MRRRVEGIGDIRVLFIHKKHERVESYITVLLNELRGHGLCISLKSYLQLSHARNYHIIHIHWPHELYEGKWSLVLLIIAIIKITLLKQSSIKLVWTVHNVMPHTRNKFGFIDLLFRRYLLKNVDLFFVHNDYAVRWLLSNDVEKGKIKKIQFPDLSSLYGDIHKTTKLNARKEIGIPADAIMYLFFGRLRPYKGFDTLIRVFRRMPKNSILVLAGLPAGADWNFDKNRHEIMSKIKHLKNVKPFLRWIKDDEVSTFFSAADYVVLPFEEITTSGTLHLAQSYLKKVIAPNICSFPEFVNSENGFLYDHNNNELEDVLIKTSKMKKIVEPSPEENKKRQDEWVASKRTIIKEYNKLVHK